MERTLELQLRAETVATRLALVEIARAPVAPRQARARRSTQIVFVHEQES